MRATTLAALDAEARRDAFNRVYEGYLLPLHLTTSQVSQHLELNDIAHDHSPVWLDDSGDIVALAALGVRDRRGWIGGFGVTPAARGQGLGTLLIGAVLEIARGLGLRRVQLEVLVGNEVARRLYDQAGFVHRRWLGTYERSIGAPPPIGVVDDLVEIDPLAALAWSAARHGEPAAWQRAPESLARLPELRALALGSPAAPEAVAVQTAGATAVNLLDLVGPPAALATLLAALATRSPASPLRVSNESVTSPLAAALLTSGWREVLRQHEMVIELAPT